MARTVRDQKLDTRNARLRLGQRREPYWRSISEGLAVGYRKGAKGGTWIAKHYSPDEGRRYQAVGTADDVADADGVHILSFTQAQAAARKWFADLARHDRSEVEPGAYSVADALRDYMADYQRRGGKALTNVTWAIGAHILPALGDIPVSQLTRRRLEAWHATLANTPARLRTVSGECQRHREPDQSPDIIRRRRSSANRVLAVVKAVLNHAQHNRRADNSEAWQAVKPFRETNAPKIRYLNEAESIRLVNACPREFRTLVTAALLTGCRYGELAAMKAGAFNPDTATVHVPVSKSGKPRHVYLTDEGSGFFSRSAAGKSAGDLLFPRADGKPWGGAHQFRPMRDACQSARIKPAISFHVLRHTYASRLAMRGVPMGVIAAQLGHADTRMTEHHYAHLAPSYVGDTVRAAFGSLGIVEESNVVPIAQ